MDYTSDRLLSSHNGSFNTVLLVPLSAETFRSYDSTGGLLTVEGDSHQSNNPFQRQICHSFFNSEVGSVDLFTPFSGYHRHVLFSVFNICHLFQSSLAVTRYLAATSTRRTPTTRITDVGTWRASKVIGLGKFVQPIFMLIHAT
jgi:hypothetical protein